MSPSSSFVPPPVAYINRPGELLRCVEALAPSRSIALDMEFDSNRYGYGVTPSLIQLASTEACFVVDLMVGLDVQPLFRLLEDARMETLVHAPGEDLRLLHRLGCFPKNIFDTEVVARLLNYEQTSQSALLAAKLGVTLNKGQQRSNWLLRPLTDAQIQYAGADVVWLHPLREVLVAEAEQKGLLPFVLDEQAALDKAVYTQEPPTDLLKPADRVAFSPWQQYVLNGLLKYRDDLARRANRPPYQMMAEDLVRGLVTGDCSPADISNHSGVHPRHRTARTATDLTNLLRRLRTEADAQGLSQKRPGRPRFTPEQQAAQRKAAHDRDHLFVPIQQALKDRFGIYATQFILSNRLIGELVSGELRLEDLSPYRQKVFGEAAKALGLDLSGYAAKAIQ